MQLGVVVGVVAGGVVSAKVLGGFVQLTQVLGAMITVLRGVGMAARALLEALPVMLKL